MQWTITNRLPENEPDETNRAEYAHPQLMGGASDDGRFVFDVVWAEMEECFVLTFLWVNDEFGFWKTKSANIRKRARICWHEWRNFRLRQSWRFKMQPENRKV